MKNLTPFQRKFYKSIEICELPFLMPTKIGQGILAEMNADTEKLYMEHLQTLPKVSVTDKATGTEMLTAPPFVQAEFNAWLTLNGSSSEVMACQIGSLLIPDGHDTNAGELYPFIDPVTFNEVYSFLSQSVPVTKPEPEQSGTTSAASIPTETRPKGLKRR